MTSNGKIRLLYKEVGTSYLHESVRKLVQDKFLEYKTNFIASGIREVVDLKGIRINDPNISNLINDSKKFIKFINSANEFLNKRLSDSDEYENVLAERNKKRILWVPVSFTEVCYVNKQGELLVDAVGKMINTGTQSTKDGYNRMFYYKYFLDEIKQFVDARSTGELPSIVDSTIIKLRHNTERGNSRISLLMALKTIFYLPEMYLDVNSNEQFLFNELSRHYILDSDIPRMQYVSVDGVTGKYHLTTADGAEKLYLDISKLNLDSTGKYNMFYSFVDNLMESRRVYLRNHSVIPIEIFYVSHTEWNTKETLTVGTLEFKNDLYGLCERISAALIEQKREEAIRSIPKGFRELTEGDF